MKEFITMNLATILLFILTLIIIIAFGQIVVQNMVAQCTLPNGTWNCTNVTYGGL